MALMNSHATCTVCGQLVTRDMWAAKPLAEHGIGGSYQYTECKKCADAPRESRNGNISIR